MFQIHPLYVFVFLGCLKMSFVRYGCLKDVFCTLWMSQRRLLYVMDVSKMSFVRYGCLKDVFCTLWMSQKRFYCVSNSFIAHPITVNGKLYVYVNINLISLKKCVIYSHDNTKK